MLDRIALQLAGQIAREGITDCTSGKLAALMDTLLNLDGAGLHHTDGIGTLLLLLCGYGLRPQEKRLADEAGLRLIRQALGQDWMHGEAVKNYPLTEMNRELETRVDNITVFEDGYVEKQAVRSIQPGIPKERWLMNDMGQAALNEREDDKWN